MQRAAGPNPAHPARRHAAAFFGKIDWLFARDLVCTDPKIVPAVDEAGEAISDHEVLVVTIAPWA